MIYKDPILTSKNKKNKLGLQLGQAQGKLGYNYLEIGPGGGQQFSKCSENQKLSEII